MKTQIFSLSFLFFASLFLMTSCTQEDLLNSTELTSEDFSVNGDDSKSERCFTLVFPVTIVFPDGTTQEFATEDALRAAKKEWKESDLYSKESHPELKFPVTVTLADGTSSEIADEEAFRELRHECKEDNHGEHGHGHGGHGHGHFAKFLNDSSCLVVSFPVSISYPDGTTVAYEDATTLLTEVKAWVKENEDSISETNRPELVFPINVTLADGSTSEIADHEALRDIMHECHKAHGDHKGKGKKGKKGKKGH